MWYVRCKHCQTENRLDSSIVPTEEDASFRLKQSGWRLSMSGKQYIKRNWSCPSCAEWWDETPTAMEIDTSGSAGQFAAAATALSFDDLNSEVEQLKAEVEGLKAEVEKWKGHVRMKDAHVVEIRMLRQEIAKLRADVIAAQHPPPASPP